MAEPQDTLKKLIKSFDQKGPELSRYELAQARHVMAEQAAKAPNSTQLPWWVARIDTRLHFIDTGEYLPDPPKPAQTKQEKQSTAIGCGVIVGAVLLVGGCVAAVSGGDDSGSSGGGDGRDEIGAKVMCEQFIEDRLKSPSSADFQNSGEYLVTGAGDEYTIRGYVDAENSFGASLRSEWTCTVRDNGDETWNLVSLTGIN